MSKCFTCGGPTEGDAESCSAACFYELEAELGTPLAGRGAGGLVVEEAEAVAREAAEEK
jgi:hypothetical protein